MASAVLFQYFVDFESILRQLEDHIFIIATFLAPRIFFKDFFVKSFFFLFFYGAHCVMTDVNVRQKALGHKITCLCEWVCEWMNPVCCIKRFKRSSRHKSAKKSIILEPVCSPFIMHPTVVRCILFPGMCMHGTL